MTVDVCVRCASLRTSALETRPCPRGGKHNWQARQQAELAIDCMTCRRRLVVHGVPFVASETHVGRTRRALLSQRARVLPWLQRHSEHELATSPFELTAAELARRSA